jgi:hypothetical protein
MPVPFDDPDVDVLLQQALLVTDAEVQSTDLSEGYLELHEEVVANGRTRLGSHHVAVHRRRRKRLLIGVALAASVVVAVPVGASAAGWRLAHTGLFGTPGATENGTGELLDTGAHDFAVVARELAAGISFPPGDSADPYIARIHQATLDGEKTHPGWTLEEEAGVRNGLRLDAVCAWAGYWLDAHTAADMGKQELAVEGLADLPPVVAYVRDAARAGDPGPVKMFWVANCASLPQLWKNQ